MLISNESVLNKLQQIKIDEREYIYFEAITQSIKIIDTSYCRLIEQLSNKAIAVDELPMIEVWIFIDSSHRLRCLLDKVPGFKKKEPWFQLTIRKLKDVEDIRHLMQHYDREIEKLISEVKPLLGHLSWAILIDDKNIQTKTIVPGILRKYQGLGMVNPVGRKFSNQIDLVTYYIGDHEIILSDLYYQLGTFVTQFEAMINQK